MLMWWLVDNWYWLNTAAETFHFWWVFFLHYYHISNPHWTLKMAHVFQHSEVNIKSLFLYCIMKITSRRVCPFKSPPWTKWPPVWQTTFSSAFSWMKNERNPVQISLKRFPRSPVNNKPELVQVSPEPMMTQFSDAYMQHLGEGGMS